MVTWLGRFYKIAIAVMPAVFVLVLTMVISFVTGHPEDLFLTRSIRIIPIRFVVLTILLAAPILALPRLLTFTSKITKNRGVFGLELVRSNTNVDRELSKLVVWALRPLQGISVSLILAERFLGLLEFSTGVSYPRFLVSIALLFMGGAFTSVFLSVVWAFDDLGVKIYNSKTAEVHMTGSSIGTFLPLITGAIGVFGLFHTNLPMDALTDLLEIVMVLYPSYVFFAVLHHEFIARRSLVLSEKLQLKRVQTTISQI
jgi:hypothetical protein